MKTTLKELNELFCLNASDYRTIKKALVNKITFVDDNNVCVNDGELEL